MTPREQQHLKRPNRPPRNQRREVLILKDDASLICREGPLGLKVVAQQATIRAGHMVKLRLGLDGRLVRHKSGGPDLAVRMRIAGAHHGPAILKDLHVLDRVHSANLDILRRPRIHHRANLLARHAGQGQAVVGMKAKHLAQPARGFGLEQRRIRCLYQRWRIRQQRRVIIHKRKNPLVCRVYGSTRALIPRA